MLESHHLLIITLQASESPGGMFADSTNPEFVSRNLAEQEVWEYEFNGFNASEPKEYEYAKKKTTDQMSFSCSKRLRSKMKTGRRIRQIGGEQTQTKMCICLYV